MPRRDAPRFSRAVGGLRIGDDFFARRALATTDRDPERGLVDRLDDLARPGVDLGAIHPDVVAFLDDTASLELVIESEWHFPWSLGWRLMGPVLRWIGQFAMPTRRGRVLTEMVALDRARDGRRDARGVIRRYADGRVMQVVAYATVERAGARFMSASFPLPGGQLGGLLRLETLPPDEEGRCAIALTNDRRDDAAGVWFVFGRLPVPAPLSERIELWPVSAAGLPDDLDASAVDGATIVGRHVQYLAWFRFVTYRYWFRPRGED